MSTTPNCPCDAVSFPETISNVPGLPSLQYRVGDFTSFRNALLQALPGEVELANWKPTSSSDLALQMIEWWAYLADVLTFYNQRIANQDYLRTADLDASVRNLVSVLGYRPRPGIGATATLAALVSGSRPITLPQGMAVQSKPGPGGAPQVFELLEKTAAQPGGLVSADPDNSKAQLGLDGTVLLQGTITSIKKGDLLLLVEQGWSGGTDRNYVLANVQSVQPQTSPRGARYTQLVLGTGALPLPSGATASSYRLLRSTQTARLFQYGVPIGQSLTADGTGTTGTADLDSVTRLIQPGDLVLFDSQNGQAIGSFAGKAATPPIANPNPIETIGRAGTIEAKLRSKAGQLGLANLSDSSATATKAFGSESSITSSSADPVSPGMYLAAVKTYAEVIWSITLAASGTAAPTTVLDGSGAVLAGVSPSSDATSTGTPIPVLHSQITFTPAVSAPAANMLVIRYSWQDAGVLMSPPAISFDGTAGLIAVVPPKFPSVEVTALLQDQKGVGASVSGTVVSTPAGALQLQPPALSPALAPPVNLLTNLLLFTRGKTVPREVLGSGDATQSGQVFILAKSPLTYLLSAASTSGNNYTSTLLVWVNGVQWQEQSSFYKQAANATIFVTREDDSGITSVQFGDGVNGSRLPSGTNNVTASYRYGSGANAPAAGTLTIINTPQPGLASLQNPVAAGGGADPELSSQMRQYAPLSALALGRAVSGDDYEAIAASTPGVNRASAVWSFDPVQQRTVVTVYVGDDAAAQSAAQLALSGDADPNRPVHVVLATPVQLTLTMTLVVNSKYDQNAVATLAVTALSDPSAGLFGSSNIGIGQVVYRSQIYAACLSIPGAVEVHDLSVTGATPGGASYRFDPGPGSYFTLGPVSAGVPPSGLQITPEVAHG